MKVEQVMTPAPATCGPGDNLAQAIERMWDADCGIIPVVDDTGHVVSVITDRDIAVAAATRGLAPGDIRAGDMQRKPVIACRPDDDLRDALELMREHRVRRLPVTTEGGLLHGIVSIDDIAQSAGTRGGVTAADVLATFKAVSGPSRDVVARGAA